MLQLNDLNTEIFCKHKKCLTKHHHNIIISKGLETIYKTFLKVMQNTSLGAYVLKTFLQHYIIC